MPGTVTREEPKPGVAVLTLNRPDRLNAMSHELLSDLHAALDDIRSDRSVRVVVLTGAGRGFCAGLDLQSGARIPGTEDLGSTQAGFATIPADEALRIHLVSRVVPDGQVTDAALEVADEIIANSPMGVWMTKEVMWSQLEIGSLQAGIDLENRTQIMCSTTGELAEAMAAVVEKRPARFHT
ncbi:MAG: enoyl-CoA hydratase/isomerase family protein [Acidimicrobiales bacterium]